MTEFFSKLSLNLRRLARGQHKGINKLEKDYRFSYGDPDRGIFYSQCGQDKFVSDYLFPEVAGGVFVDVGANDGVTFSNTYYLEKKLGWTGMCIEPNPRSFSAMVQTRSCFCENVCISENSGFVDFARVEGPGILDMYSGILGTFGKKEIRRIKKNNGNIEVIRVPSVRLQELFRKHLLFHVNYLSVDTEGSEIQVLKSIDFSETKIDVLSIENNKGNRDVRLFLEKKGFQYHVTLGDLDDIYISKEMDEGLN